MDYSPMAGFSLGLCPRNDEFPFPNNKVAFPKGRPLASPLCLFFNLHAKAQVPYMLFSELLTQIVSHQTATNTIQQNR